MSAVEAARAALADAERRAAEADEACASAEAEFKRAPSTKSHSAAAVATQVAANAHAEITKAEAAVADADRGVTEERLRAAIERGSPDALLERARPAMARLRELHSEIAKLATELTTACADQAQACRDAREIARTLGSSAPTPLPVAPTFLRAVIGIRIARDVYLTGDRWALGLEPATFVVPRPAPPHGHPEVNEWRAARKLALPASEFLPGPAYDFGPYEAREFFHAR